MELHRRQEELKTLNKKAQLNQLQIQIGRLKVELSAKDNDVKRIEDNLGYSQHEHSKLMEEVAAPRTRLLISATEKNRVRKWGQFWKRQVTALESTYLVKDAA